MQEVLEDEKEEKAFRVAEMEANKASNIITYKDEIMARPARSWFQTEKERTATKESAKTQQPTSARVVADEEPKPEDSWIKKVRAFIVGGGGKGGGGGGGEPEVVSPHTKIACVLSLRPASAPYSPLLTPPS